MLVFLVIEEDGFDGRSVNAVYSSLHEAVQSAELFDRIECFEIGPKGLIAIYGPKGNLLKSFF